MLKPIVKFLLVDDMAENLLALEGLLRRDGLLIHTTKSGMEALELLLDNDYALAILDVQMPIMDGFELAELMRCSVRTRHIPIIFLTAGGLDERRKFRGYEAGAVDFLFKPIDPTITKGKAEVFYDLFCRRQEVVQQRDGLRLAMEENTLLYKRIVDLNSTLEKRVTERTMQLMEANELLQGFAYSIAHDFRQHIRNVNTNAQMVLADSVESFDQCRPKLERIVEAAKLMNQMTDDLLVHARARSAPLRLTNIDLSELATEIAASCSIIRPLIEYHISQGVTVCGDATMVRIALENLLENAFKFSEHVVNPFVEFGSDEEGFFVRDNGIGFDAIYSDKVFQMFERLMPETEYSGTGMGLTNAKKIIERHGGKICVCSEPGRGCTFHFSLSS